MQSKTVGSRKRGTAILYSQVIQSDDIEHARKLIEEAFDEDQLLTPTDMKKRFGKYGWGKHED